MTYTSRRSFLKKTGRIVMGLSAANLVLTGGCATLGAKKEAAYLKNEKLDTILKGYPGNPFINGRFVNETFKPDITFGDMMKWRFSSNPQKKEKKNDAYIPEVMDCSAAFGSRKDMIVWMGHSTFFLRLAGRTIITDPVLYNPPFLKRKPGLPCRPGQIGPIDHLLVSHNHYDHLDSDTLKSLDLEGTDAHVPLGMGDTIKSIRSGLKIQEAGWYQKFDTAGIEIYMMPAQHWSKRIFHDTNASLWGSFIIRGAGKTVYFAGDTAYSPHLKKTGSLFKKMDYCLMPVGAYMPEYIMKSNHLSPVEAVDGFHDLGGRVFIPNHFGTFDLSDEPPGEPARLLEDMKKKKAIRGDLKVLKIGEILEI